MKGGRGSKAVGAATKPRNIRNMNGPVSERSIRNAVRKVKSRGVPKESAFQAVTKRWDFDEERLAETINEVYSSETL